MGNKPSPAGNHVPATDDVDGTSTMARAIARGRVYVILRYPKAAERVEGASFNEEQFREILAALQQYLVDFEITLEAERTNNFCEHVTFYNNADPNKEMTRPRVLVEVFNSGVFGSQNKDKIKKLVQERLDPNGYCYFDCRSEMGRYHTSSHLETLLRL